jgi:hypothetical protein
MDRLTIENNLNILLSENKGEALLHALTHFVSDLRNMAFTEGYTKGQSDLRDPHLPHVTKMLVAMEREIRLNQIGGSFVHSVCIGDWEKAIDIADSINILYLKVYKDFVQKLKDEVLNG